MTGFYYKDKELQPETPEADELARKIWTTLAELYCKERGYELGAIEFEPKIPATTK